MRAPCTGWARRHHDRVGAGLSGAAADAGVPAHAATITVAWGLSEPSLEPAGARQLVLDGRPVTGACSWPFGGVVRVATAVLQLMRPETPDAHLSPVDGGLAYHRPPRFRPDLKPVKIEVPAEPKKGHGNGVTMLLSAAVPMVMGGVMVYVTRQWLYSLFMLMMPVMVLGTWLSGSKQRGGSHHRKMRAYTRQMAEVEAKMDQARAADEQRRREDAMDPAQVLLTATGPRRRLWERQADDSDTLRMRIGLFDGPAMIQLVTAKEAEPPAVPTAFCVPVSMRLTTTGVLGLAGPVDASRALARWLVAQAAVLHSPRDLSIVVLAADPAAGPHWNWVRWLPHCAPRGSEDCVALVGTDLESASKRVTELVAEVTARLAKAPAEAAEAVSAEPRPNRWPTATWVRRSWSCWTGRGSCAGSLACRNFSPPRRGPASTRSASTSQRACCRKSAPWCCPGTSPGRETATTMACGSGPAAGRWRHTAPRRRRCGRS